MISALLLMGAAFADGIQIEADSIVISAKTVLANGDVKLSFQDILLHAKSMHILPGAILLEKGHYTQNAQKYEFAYGVYRVDSTLIDVEGVQLQQRPPNHDQKAAIFPISGHFKLNDVKWSTCRCETPPWSFEAGSVTLTGVDVSFSDGSLVIYDCIKAPLPQFVLDHWDSFPQFSIHDDHYRLAFPIHTTDKWMNHRVTPELRFNRSYGASVESKLLDNTHEVKLIGHHLYLDNQVRGGVSWNGRTNWRDLTVFSKSSASTDSHFWSDYSIQNRNMLPNERRIWISKGPIGVHHNQRGPFQFQTPIQTTLNIQHSIDPLFIFGRLNGSNHQNEMLSGKLSAYYSKRISIVRLQGSIDIQPELDTGETYTSPEFTIDIPMWSKAFNRLSLMNVGINMTQNRWRYSLDWQTLLHKNAVVSGEVQTDFDSSTPNDEFNFQIVSRSMGVQLDLNHFSQNAYFYINNDSLSWSLNWFNNDIFHRIQAGFSQMRLHKQLAAGFWMETDLNTPSWSTFRWDSTVQFRDKCDCFALTLWSSLEPVGLERSYGIRLHLLNGN